MESSGRSLTNHLVIVFALVKFWVELIFQVEVDAKLIEGRVMSIDSTSTIFKQWNPHFYANNENSDTILVLFRILGLPDHLWNEEIFRLVGNQLSST